MATQYTLNDYIAYVQTSHKKRLLVEGPDDYRLFSRLLDVFDKQRKQVDIDDASCLIGFEHPLGNRDKVELVCSKVKDTDFSAKLVGFVDRDFRGFSWNPDLQDNIKFHRINDRLVWTRGHSIENYYFEFETLREPISTLSSTPYYQLALDVFERNFERVIRLACISSLLGLEIENFEIIRSSISWKIFNLTDGEICLALSVLDNIMRTKNLPDVIINQVISRFDYWEQLVSRADYDLVRWICHGHMGLTFIWAAFKRIVFEVSKNEGCPRPKVEVEHTLDTKEDIRFNAIALKWITRSLGNETVFPFEVLKMLGLRD